MERNNSKMRFQRSEQETEEKFGLSLQFLLAEEFKNIGSEVVDMVEEQKKRMKLLMGSHVVEDSDKDEQQQEVKRAVGM